MTGGEQQMSPELRELLGEVGAQRESALFTLTRSDRDKVIQRPGREGIGRSAGRFTLAEREILDGYRHELARCITDRTVAAVVQGILGEARKYVLPDDRAARLDVKQSGDAAVAAAKRVPSESAMTADAVSGGESDVDSYQRLQACAVRLVPSGRARYHLADILRLKGSESSACQALRGVIRDFDGSRVASVSAEFVAGIYADNGAVAEACKYYRLATEMSPQRVVPGAGWLFQAIRLTDQGESQAAISAIDGSAGVDLVALETTLKWRQDARDRGEWSSSSESRQLVKRMRVGVSETIEGVFRVFD